MWFGGGRRTGARPTQFNHSLCLRHFSLFRYAGYWGTNGLCLVSVVRLFRALHTFLHSSIHSLLLFLFLFSLPTIHPSCIFPILPSHPTTRPSSCIPISEAYCFQSGCIIRLGDSDATPRRALASQLRHPIFLVSRLPTAWLSIAPGRPDTGTHTHLPHTPIHSYIHSDITPTTYDDHKHSSGEETQANRHPTARRIRLRAQTSDKVPRKSDYKEQRNTPSATRHYTGTVITQHGTTRLDSTRHSIT